MDRNQKVKIFQDRFYGRLDVYGRKWHSVDKDGKQIKGYAPVCENLWKPNCHLRLKDGVSCANCEIQEHAPVTEESIWKHISGEEEHIYYIVHNDNMAYFAAFDCDQKPGKESMGHSWNDVKTISRCLDELSIPHAIARSTGTGDLYGHHVYIFTDKAYPASKLRALSFFIMEKCGFMEELRQGIRPLPEFFPKQNYTGGFGIGNGIKPPMCEQNFSKGRNGFITGEDEFVPPEKQWEFLANAPRVETEILDKIIEDNGIEVDETTASPSGSKRGTFGPGGIPRRGKWQQPLNGSYEKVVEGCKALRRVYEKAAAGEVPGHHEGFAAYHLAMSCADGLEYFRKNMNGWAQTDKDMRQLEHSLNKDYAPWSCKKMQEHGVCVPGTKCFEKKPPMKVVEGQYVVDTDVPQEQWPEPSPIRFAFGKGEDFLGKLKADVDTIDPDSDTNEKGRKLRDIALRAQVFDEDQQRDLKEFIKAKKLLKWADVSKMFTKASDVHIKETKERAATRTDSIVSGNNCYREIRDHSYGYELLKKTRSGHEWIRFTDFIIEIHEEREYLDDDRITRSVFIGVFKTSHYEIKFEIPCDAWFENKDIVKYFGVLVGSHFSVMRTDLDHMRIASMGFSRKRGIEKCNFLETQGWYQNTYLMPSVLVDAAGVRPNTEKVVALDTKPHSSSLDFKLIPEDELRQLLFHVKSDFFNAWPRPWTMTAWAHGLLPAVVTPLGIRKKPALFFEGLTGSGKTELLHAVQYLWGGFDSLVNLTSTGKGMLTVAHDFKDALLVFDDYKGLDKAQNKALQMVIQYSYDLNAGIKLNKDSTIMKPLTTRGVIAFTGENFLTNDSAMVARTILIEVDKQDTQKTREQYGRVLEMREHYNAITPHFINWFLQQDLKMIKIEIHSLQRNFYDNVRTGKVNTDRISYNLALNHVIWRMWSHFLLYMGLVTDNECLELCDEHMGYCYDIQKEMIDRCSDEQNGAVFLRVLQQLISSNAAVIEGFNDDIDEGGYRGTVIGFLQNAQGTIPTTVNLFPDVVCRMIHNETRDTPIRGTPREFGRQFAEMGKLIMQEGRYKHQVRYKKSRPYVWQFIATELGLFKDGVGEVIQGGYNPSKSAESRVAAYGADREEDVPR